MLVYRHAKKIVNNPTREPFSFTLHSHTMEVARGVVGKVAGTPKPVPFLGYILRAIFFSVSTLISTLPSTASTIQTLFFFDSLAPLLPCRQ